MGAGPVPGAALGLGVAVVLLLVFGAQVLRTREAERSTPPQRSETLRVAGLEDLVQIDFDRHGVPHIEAAGERDAFFALGFSHARDRLAQLLRLRRHAQGRVAEHEGPSAVDSDRLARVIGFARLAEAQWAKLDAAPRDALVAYAAGVNAQIQRVGAGSAALVGRRDGGAIEAWRPQDSIALYKLFAWSMGATLEEGLVLNELVEALGPRASRRFFPESAADVAKRGFDASALAGYAGVLRGQRRLRSAWGLYGYGVGSSAFVLGGVHSESGAPILVADSHFQVSAPAAFHLVHLRSPGRDVAGATLPGVPVFWWGRNAKLAWAPVHSGAVVTDLYTETLRAEGREYHDGKRWREVERSEETIAVRGAPDVAFVRRVTRHGPLLPEASGAAGGAISVAWTGARTDIRSGIASLLEVAAARDGDALREALRSHHEPALVMLWAGVDASAGLQQAGWIPKRSLAPQLLPLPGRAVWYAWKESIDFDALASAQLVSGEGFLVAADQHFQLGESDARVDVVWRPGVRAARLENRLTRAVEAGSADVRGLAALQSDVKLERSLRIIDTALALVRESVQDEEARELMRLLRNWDGRATPESHGSAVYHGFLHGLADAIFEEGVGPERFRRLLALPTFDLEGLVERVLFDAATGGEDRWSAPAFVRSAVKVALRETFLDLSFRHGPDPRRWRWGEVHPLRFRAAPGLDDLGPYLMGGAPHAVLAAGYAAAEPFDVNVASVARFAVDLAAPDLALTALAPGQSEDPRDPLYDAGVAPWLEGRHQLLATRRIEVEDRSVARLLLQPQD